MNIQQAERTIIVRSAFLLDLRYLTSTAWQEKERLVLCYHKMK